MLKGNAVTNTITIIGIAAIGALMFTKVPGMIDDIKIVLSKASVIGKAAELADQLTLSMSAPDEIKLIYKLVPEDISYTVSVKDGIVNVSTDKDWAVSKTISDLCYKFDPCEVGYTYSEEKKTCTCNVIGEEPAEEFCPLGNYYEHEKCKHVTVKTLAITKTSIEKVD